MSTHQAFLLGMVCGAAIVVPIALWLLMKIAACVPRIR